MEGGCAGQGGVGEAFSRLRSHFFLLRVALRLGDTPAVGLRAELRRRVCPACPRGVLLYVLFLAEVAFEPVHGLLDAIFGGGVAGAVVDETGVFVGG